MNKKVLSILLTFIVSLVFSTQGVAGKFNFWNSESSLLKQINGQLEIPVSSIDDGKAHHFRVQANDGTMVHFFTLKSRDGVIRAAMDACDVCYRSGKGYVQEEDFMVCQNCGQKFASNKINEIKGGCNPAPLKRKVAGDNLVISMADIDANSWYFKYRK